jgi:hypothetical protein
MSTKTMMAVAITLATVLASPAFAQSANWQDLYNAYARQTQTNSRQQAWRPSSHQSSSVYGTDGQRIGSDPDPDVRNQLAHDPSQGGNVH